MIKNWKKWAKDKNLKKWLKKDNLIVLVLTGILLVIIALPTNNGSATKEDGSRTGEGKGAESESLPEGKNNSGGEGENVLSESRETADSDREYADYLEKKLKETLSQIADVGQVRVMITLKSSRELVVEKEQPVSRSTTNENDSQGGSRIVSQMDSKENTVYSTSGNVSEPYVIMTLPPQIEGVVVVAEGAGNGTVNRTIVDIVQALFDVEAHKVRVVPMDSR